MKLIPESIFDERYRIISEIGSGGMADVYKAYDIRKKRIVAIKRLKDEVAQNAEFVRRFHMEAQAVRQFSHRGIVQLYDIGVEQERPYIVLEYIEGSTLKQLIREQGALDKQYAIRIALEICEALQHAHQKNLVHRDIKPQNILLDKQGHAKITDFGIARFVDSNTMTYMGANVLGSVHYVSPEQARGENVGIGSDIYSLGIVLYEMLTGKLPFESENTVTLVLKQIQEVAPKLSETCPNLGRALNDIVAKAMQKKPEQRYGDAQSMKKDLLRALREPEGKFVKINKAENRKNYLMHARSQWGGVGNIILAIIMILGLLISVFLIVGTIFSEKESNLIIYVPQLIGKTEEDAAKFCRENNLKLKVRSYINNGEYPQGQIFTQYPSYGDEGKSGDLVEVDISLGEQQIEAPDLLGRSIEDVVTEIGRSGLEYDIQYEASDQAEGIVLHQFPEPNVMCELGDYITIWVSGDSNSAKNVPLVINQRFREVIPLIKNNNINNVMLRYKYDSTNVSNIILNQKPAAGDFLNADQMFELTLSTPRNFSYVAHFNTDIIIQEYSSDIIITSVLQTDDMKVEEIWFEKSIKKGKHKISADIYGNTNEIRTVRIYADGDLVNENRVELQRQEKISGNSLIVDPSYNQ